MGTELLPYFVFTASILVLLGMRELANMKQRMKALERKLDVMGGLGGFQKDSVDAIAPAIKSLLESGDLAGARKLAAEKLHSPEEFKRLNALVGDQWRQ